MDLFDQKSVALQKLHEIGGILINKGITKYAIVKDYGAFLNLIKGCNYPDYFEYIPGKKPVCFFFDIEIYKDQCTYFDTPNHIISLCVDKIKSSLSDSITIKRIILESHSHDKKSFHILLRLFDETHREILFQNVGVVKSIFKSLSFHTVKDQANKHIIDPSVYREGLFRTIYSSKTGENRPLVKSTDSDPFEDIEAFVCHHSSDFVMFDEAIHKSPESPASSASSNSLESAGLSIRATDSHKCQEDCTNSSCPTCSTVVNVPQDMDALDKENIRRFVKNRYHHFPSRIRDVFIDQDLNCIVVALNEKGCHFIDREHKSNNQYIVIDTQSSKQKCHDPDCLDKKHNEIKLLELPVDIQEIIKKCLKVNKKELDLIEKAIEECKQYITDNYDTGIRDISFDRNNMVFRGDVSDPGLVAMLRGRCPQCRIEHQISDNGYCLKCTICQSTFPRMQLIPVDDRYRTLNRFWLNYNQIINHGTVNTVINNYYTGGDEEFSCDVQLDPTIYRDRKLLNLLNECLDGHKITKMAELMYHLFKNYVFAITDWYCFDDKRWIIDRQRIFFKRDIMKLCKYLGNVKQHYENKHSDSTTMSVIKNIKSLINKLHKPQLKDDIIKEAQLFYADSNFTSKLNCKKHLVPFHNGVFDLLESKFRKTRKDDYVSLTVGYDCRSNVFNQEVYDFIEQVLPSENVRDYVLKKFSECLNGDIPNTNFLMFIGDGANGKSQLLNLMKLTMGELGEKVEVTLLTRKRNNANEANTEKIKLMNKRFAFLSEPEDGEKINIGLLKELTGSEEIVARGLYQDSMSFVMEAKLFLACNELPDIKGEDTALWRRIRVIDFPSRFVDDPKEHNEFKIDKTLPSRMREDITWRQTFMNILLDYHNKAVSEPDEVQVRTNEYREENNDFINWLSENVEYKENSILRLKQTVELFVCKRPSNSELSKKKKVIEKWIQVTFPHINYRFQNSTTNAMPYKGWQHLQIKDLDVLSQ